MTAPIATPEPNPVADQADRRSAMLRDNIATHEAIRARFARGADPAALDRLARGYAMPAWARGAIGVLDACFLYDLIAAVRPSRVIEIGTASGGSTATILRAMSEHDLPLTTAAGPAVRSFDLHPMCFSDRTKPVGAAIHDLAAHLAHGVGFTTGATSLNAGRSLAGWGAQLAFIDADHRHPWPTIDLLALLPALAPGAWVVLHDIDLPAAASRYERAHRTRVDWHHAGAQWLYQAWPFDKLAGLGQACNIGAVALPDQPQSSAQLRSAVSAVLAQPFEVAVPPDAAALLESITASEATP